MPLVATWIHLETVILSEVSQRDKDKYHMISLICNVRKKIQMNSFTKHWHTDIENTKGKGGER